MAAVVLIACEILQKLVPRTRGLARAGTGLHWLRARPGTGLALGVGLMRCTGLALPRADTEPTRAGPGLEWPGPRLSWAGPEPVCAGPGLTRAGTGLCLCGMGL